MRPLNTQSIMALKKELKDSHTVKTIAFQSGKVWIVTNGAWLMEWPEKLVEDCPQLHKLIANGEDKKNYSGMGPVSTPECTLRQQLESKPWRDSILSSKRFYKAKEVDPTDAEIDHFESGALVYELHKKRYYYQPSFMDAAELFLEPTIMLQKPDHLHSNAMIAGFFDGDHLVGVCMNILMGSINKEGEDDDN